MFDSLNNLMQKSLPELRGAQVNALKVKIKIFYYILFKN